MRWLESIAVFNVQRFGESALSSERLQLEKVARAPYDINFLM